MAGSPPGPAEFVVVGTNHRSSPVMLRDQLFIEDAAVPGFLERLRRDGVAQAIVLSTCDRVEVQAAHGEPDDAARGIISALAEQAELELGALAECHYTLKGEEAIRHIFAVAASLDSMVIGEPHVLGQVKAGHRLARAAGTIGPELEAVLQAAYGVAKRVRTETQIAERPVSIAAVAVQLARDLHGGLERCGALLIGPSDMGELMADQLLAAGLDRLVVAARTAVRAEAIARRFGCHFTPFEALATALDDADIIVTGLGAGGHLLTAEMVEAALKRRRRKPIFLIDVALPGDVEPAVSRLDGAFVYDLDDLERVAIAGRATREAAAQAAWRIIDEEVEAFLHSRRERAAVPVLKALRRHFEEVREDMLADIGTADAREATRLLVRRLLHRPTEALRKIAAEEDAAGRGQGNMTERVLRRLFGLDGGEEGNAGNEEEKRE